MAAFWRNFYFLKWVKIRGAHSIVKKIRQMPPFSVMDIDEAFDPAAVEEVEFFLWYGFLRPKSRRIRIVVMCEDGGKQSMAAAGKLR